MNKGGEKKNTFSGCAQPTKGASSPSMPCGDWGESGIKGNSGLTKCVQNGQADRLTSQVFVHGPGVSLPGFAVGGVEGDLVALQVRHHRQTCQWRRTDSQLCLDPQGEAAKSGGLEGWRGVWGRAFSLPGVLTRSL